MTAKRAKNRVHFSYTEKGAPLCGRPTGMESTIYPKDVTCKSCLEYLFNSTLPDDIAIAAEAGSVRAGEALIQLDRYWRGNPKAPSHLRDGVLALSKKRVERTRMSLKAAAQQCERVETELNNAIWRAARARKEESSP